MISSIPLTLTILTSASPELTGRGTKLMEERLIRRLMSTIKCSSCGQHYESYDIDVLGHNEDIWFLQVRCSHCHTQSLVAAIIKETRMPKVVSDLTKAEMDKLRHFVLVNADDVLSMHEFLNEFDGDFSHLFGRRQPTE